MNGWGRVKQKVMSLLYPQHCAYCGKIIAQGEAVCAKCTQKLPRVEPPLCLSCGRGLRCCTCTRRFQFRRCVSPFYYDGCAKDGLWRLKFNGKTDGVPVLAHEMAGSVRAQYGERCADLVVCVPSTRAAMRLRGYNQAELLAQRLAQELELPCDADALQKVLEISQRSMDALARRENVIGAYAVAKDELIKGKNILLVDDVITTGATLNECAKVMKQAGAKDILCVTYACTRPKRVVKSIKMSYNTDIR
ncbi:MAG: ComF family protein [Clostridiales bacterium]|nr:ComF family protein [Clostridiales bacterium]